MRPARSTSHISAITRPAPELQNSPRGVQCPPGATPSLALYWHIGETTMRLGSSRSASLMGENRALMGCCAAIDVRTSNYKERRGGASRASGESHRDERSVAGVERLHPRRLLAGEHGGEGEQALLAGTRAFVVVKKLEIALLQLEDRHIGRRADGERAALVEGREHACRVDGPARDRLVDRHAEHEQLRHDVRHIDDAGGADRKSVV